LPPERSGAGPALHIALFSPAWPIGRQPNGIVTYVDALATEMRAQGHRVSIVSPDVGVEIDDPDVERVRLRTAERIAFAVRVKALRRPPTTFDFGRAVTRAFHRLHSRSPIDVIEMEESFGFAAQVARAVDVPLVVKLHGPAFLTMTEQELQTPFGRRKVRTEHDSLARLPAITAPSRCTLSDTLSHYRLRPPIAEHIVNPVDLSTGSPLWSSAGCSPETLLFVGRFDAIKGGDLVIAAFRRLLAERPALRLVFVGPDHGLEDPNGGKIHLREFIATFDHAMLQQRVVVRGVLAPPEIRSLRADAAVTIVASRRESQGYAALEAMLQGCPVVCTDTSGLGEIVEHGVTGLKARPDDAEDLAAQIDRLLADPSLGAALGRAARAYVIDQHSPATVVRKTVAVYRRAIELRGRP
jgi:glycosyltransferase involved in cell wall biosynthesis